MSGNGKIVAGVFAAIVLAAGMAAASNEAKAKLYWSAAGLGMAAGALVRSGAGRATKTDFHYVAEPGFRRCGFVARYDAQGNVAGVVKACTVSEY